MTEQPVRTVTSRSARVLPADLVAALGRVRRVEAIALEDGGVEARQRAVRGTGAVILAAVQLGWRITEVAQVLGLTRQAVGNRLHAARALYGEHSPALVFDAPLDCPPGPRSGLDVPVEGREWFTRPEAAALAGVHPFTIGNWLQAGLLPHTDRTHLPHLILRADLVRVMRAPRYNGRGVDYASVHAQLRRSLGRGDGQHGVLPTGRATVAAYADFRLRLADTASGPVS